MSQLSFPTPLTATEVMRCTSFGDSLEQCRKVAGLEPKQVQEHVRTSEGKPVDKAAWSRWKDDSEFPKWRQLVEIMDACGNDAPLLWMLHARGYEISSLRRQETETEKELRKERELRVEAEKKVAYFEQVMTGRTQAAA